MDKFEKSEKIILLGSLFFIFVIYVIGMPYGVGLIDEGELYCVAKFYGIPHPTGYPLWVNLYRIFYLTGIPLQIFSALFVVLSIFLLYKILREIFGLSLFVSLSIVFSFAFIDAIWKSAFEVEVYPLSFFLSLLLLYSFFKNYNTPFIFYLAGLNLTNHFFSLSFVLPILFYMFLKNYKNSKFYLNFLFFVIPLSLYLFLPIRSFKEPLFDWGDPQIFWKFLNHLRGYQYSVWFFEKGLNLKRGLRIFLSLLKVFSLFPFVFLFLKNKVFSNLRKYVYLLFFVFLISFIYISGYEIPDIEPYFFGGIVASVLLFSLIFKILSKIKVFNFISFILPVFFFVSNYKYNLRPKDKFPYLVSEITLKNLPQNSILMSNYWDIVSPCLYLHFVKGFRRDVVIVDKELLRRSWYYKYLKKVLPEFYKKNSSLINRFIEEVEKFERNEPYNGDTLQKLYIEIISKILEYRKSVVIWGLVGFDEYEILNKGKFKKFDFKRFPEFDFLVREFEKFRRTEREIFLMRVIYRGGWIKD